MRMPSGACNPLLGRVSCPFFFLSFFSLFFDLIRSSRYDGLNIVVYIKYEQSKKIGDNSIVYTYVPKVMADLEYKVESIHYEDDGRKYEIYNRHGTSRLWRYFRTISHVLPPPSLLTPRMTRCI